MSATSYQEYKESGVQWLGSIPAHWEVAPFKRLVDIRNGRDHKHVEQDDGYPVIGSGGPFAFASKYLYDGDSVLLGRKGTVDKPLYVKGRFWTVDTMYWSKIRSGVCGKFAFYAATTIPFSYYSTSTALPSMTKGTLNANLVALPPLVEQMAIAEFLDRETARIDQLIEKKQRLVELLREKDKATVKLHVLGQLGERDRRPCEAVWLPDLPSEWPVQRCAHLFRNLDSSRIPLNAEQRGDLEKIYPYYGASGVIDYVDQYIFEGENILVGEDGANLVMQSTPIAFKATGKYWVNNHAHIIHPRFGIIDYWVHALNQVPYEIYVTGSAQPKLTSEALGNIRLPCPPEDEQRKIVETLEKKRRALTALRDPINSSIDGLREFRSALITAAVTGQIDVTAWGKSGHTDRRLDQIEEEMSLREAGA